MLQLVRIGMVQTAVALWRCLCPLVHAGGRGGWTVEYNTDTNILSIQLSCSVLFHADLVVRGLGAQGRDYGEAAARDRRWALGERAGAGGVWLSDPHPHPAGEADGAQASGACDSISDLFLLE